MSVPAQARRARISQATTQHISGNSKTFGDLVVRYSNSGSLSNTWFFTRSNKQPSDILARSGTAAKCYETNPALLYLLPSTRQLHIQCGRNQIPGHSEPRLQSHPDRAVI